MSGKARVGLIMPQAADVLPREGIELFPEVTFLPRGVGVTSLTPEGYDNAVANIVPAACDLAEAGAAAIMIFGTSLTFYRGVTFHDELVERVREATGLETSSMSAAVVEGLKAVSARSIAVCTAYGETVNAKLEAFLTQLGFRVLTLDGLGVEKFGVTNTIPQDAIFDLAVSACRNGPEAEGLLISCGGLRTLDLTVRLEQELSLPVISSAPAALWKCARMVAPPRSISGHGCLLERE